jgi:hypothetical protein
MCEYIFIKVLAIPSAMVEYFKTNVKPLWGLYNWAIGGVVDILYKK